MHPIDNLLGTSRNKSICTAFSFILADMSSPYITDNLANSSSNGSPYPTERIFNCDATGNFSVQTLHCIEVDVRKRLGPGNGERVVSAKYMLAGEIVGQGCRTKASTQPL